MKKVYFIQINNFIAEAVFLPLSIAYLWEYCKTIPEITDNWGLGGIFFEREPVEDLLDKIQEPDLVGISCYVWNWEISLQVVSKIKSRYPNCKIVLGGPQPPYEQKWLMENPDVDLVVTYSGEYIFADILLGKTNIPGVISRDFPYVEPTPIVDIDSIPSPYLSGLMNSLMRPNIKYSAMIETNRGCPYKCTFCDQGADYYNKLYKFDFDRVMAEIDWVAENKIEFLMFADSNLGIFDRDLDFLRRVAHHRKTTGYPNQIDYATAKQQPNQIVELGRIINQEAGIKRGVTIALQSMNPKTLTAIKRINVANIKLEQIINNYNKAGIDNYCELILGLPEETFNTFVDSIGKILELGSEHALMVHPLSVVPNTPFSEPEYKKKYGLQYTPTAAPAGGNTYPNDSNGEIDYICYASNTMPESDWIDAYFFAKGIVIPHHYHGISQVIATYLHKIHNVPLLDFYLLLFEYSKKSNGVLNKEYIDHTDNVKKSLFSMKTWGRPISSEDDFHFQDNAATAAILYSKLDEVHEEIISLVKSTYDIDVAEVARFNSHILNKYQDSSEVMEFNFNWASWFSGKELLENKKTSVTVTKKKFINMLDHARYIFWYGRKSKRCFLEYTESNVKEENDTSK